MKPTHHRWVSARSQLSTWRLNNPRPRPAPAPCLVVVSVLIDLHLRAGVVELRQLVEGLRFAWQPWHGSIE